MMKRNTSIPDTNPTLTLDQVASGLFKRAKDLFEHGKKGESIPLFEQAEKLLSEIGPEVEVQRRCAQRWLQTAREQTHTLS